MRTLIAATVPLEPGERAELGPADRHAGDGPAVLTLASSAPVRLTVEASPDGGATWAGRLDAGGDGGTWTLPRTDLGAAYRIALEADPANSGPAAAAVTLDA